MRIVNLVVTYTTTTLVTVIWERTSTALNSKLLLRLVSVVSLNKLQPVESQTCDNNPLNIGQLAMTHAG